MSGVTIGDGAVICANSHVIKDVAPYSNIRGDPAKHIQFRFTEKQIQSLLCECGENDLWLGRKILLVVY